jgi:hypothetical protein
MSLEGVAEQYDEYKAVTASRRNGCSGGVRRHVIHQIHRQM